MFRTLSKGFKQDKDYPDRTYQLSLYRAVLNGSIYSNLRSDFHEERTGSGEYVPLRARVPSVRFNICRMAVLEISACLFDESRFPRVVDATRESVSDLCQVIIRDMDLPAVMSSAVLHGSPGSIAMHMRVLKGRVFWKVMTTEYLTPKWLADAPDTLESVEELYKVKGSAVIEMGYPDVVEPWQVNADFWYRRVWNDMEELWFVPVPCVDKRGEKQRPTVVDPDRSVVHRLGFVPMVWIRAPGHSGMDDIDGPCVFAGVIDNQIEVEYLLSQGGRGLKYSSDPLLLVKEPAAADSSFVRDGSNALVVSEKGDAKLLEIGGGSSDAVIEFCRYVRQCALEAIRMNRSDPQKMNMPQSGRALEMMNQAFLGMIGEYRVAYGTNGLVKMMEMVFAAARKVPVFLGKKRIRVPSDTDLHLKWASFFPLTAHEEYESGMRVRSDTEGGLISRRSAVIRTGDFYDVVDVDAEMAQIKIDQAEADARVAKQAAQIKATETIED